MLYLLFLRQYIESHFATSFAQNMTITSILVTLLQHFLVVNVFNVCHHNVFIVVVIVV